jgi:NADH-quinone oxidoreductase subunit L
MYHAIVFLPLLGCLIAAGLFGRLIGAPAPSLSRPAAHGRCRRDPVLGRVRSRSVGHERMLSSVQVCTWITSGDLQLVPRAGRLGVPHRHADRGDAGRGQHRLGARALYSIGYMHHDPHRPRFFAYLSLFTFAMLMLVTADNLVQMFFGWEGVGLASYLLIGFWYKKPSANAAAIKAFVVNRVGDFGFALGIFGVFVLFGSVDFDTDLRRRPRPVAGRRSPSSAITSTR